uniref:Uncharacterized protein n=1 Tax=Rhizophora mucronata TaxID=61149 RepID=A0A2P2N978_RHIMU
MGLLLLFFFFAFGNWSRLFDLIYEGLITSYPVP